MSDLTITIKYSHASSNAVATGLQLSFLLWGIVAPLTSLACILAAIVAPGLIPASMMVKVLIASLAISLLGYRLNRLFEKQDLIADKSGIELPTYLAAAFSAKFVAWSGMSRIAVLSNSRSRSYITFTTSAGESRTIDCARLSTGELEQLLLAIQLWAPPSARDETVLQLQETVKSQSLLEDRSKLDPSYTALWEDELRRRFRQVAFLPLEAGATLRNGSLTVVRQLAMGGLSAIYLCQLDGRDLVVVKEAVTPEDSLPELRQKAEELFQREAMILMKLSHKNVVKVLDYFAGGGRNYIMLEYVNGRDLRQYVKQNGRVREAVVLEWAKQMGSVLQYLHEQVPPVIHRDFTPDNVVVRDDGEIVVIDFGAANEFIGNSTGTFVGKQCYIAPEQFRGKAVPQSDIYAFGCTMNFLLTGQDPVALSVSHPKRENDLVSAEMDAFVARCTDADCLKRPDSVSLAREVEALMSRSAGATA